MTCKNRTVLVKLYGFCFILYGLLLQKRTDTISNGVSFPAYFSFQMSRA